MKDEHKAVAKVKLGENLDKILSDDEWQQWQITKNEDDKYAGQAYARYWEWRRLLLFPTSRSKMDHGELKLCERMIYEWGQNIEQYSPNEIDKANDIIWHLLNGNIIYCEIKSPRGKRRHKNIYDYIDDKLGNGDTNIKNFIIDIGEETILDEKLVNHLSNYNLHSRYLGNNRRIERVWVAHRDGLTEITMR